MEINIPRAIASAGLTLSTIYVLTPPNIFATDPVSSASSVNFHDDSSQSPALRLTQPWSMADCGYRQRRHRRSRVYIAGCCLSRSWSRFYIYNTNMARPTTGHKRPLFLDEASRVRWMVLHFSRLSSLSPESVARRPQMERRSGVVCADLINLERADTELYI